MSVIVFTSKKKIIGLLDLKNIYVVISSPSKRKIAIHLLLGDYSVHLYLIFFQSLSHFHTLATIYIVRVNAESQNYRYESIQTTAGIIDPNEICIAMIDGNLSILVHLLDLSFLSSSNNFLGERNALFL